MRNVISLLLICAASSALAPPARAIYSTFLNNGASSNRVDIVFLGDGYTSSELNAYQSHISSMMSHLFNQGEEPFPRYRNYFNAHRIDVISQQSGADDPSANFFVNTALDARYLYDGITQRLLYVSNAKATTALSSGLGGALTADMRLVAVNATQYGGGGGTYAVYAGGNSSATEIALHELGHSFAGLADEYGGNTGTYTGNEPIEVNLTKNSTGAKWSRWIGYNQPGIGTIGAYEGGGYYDHGLYRPSFNSKMRALNQPFDAVSREEIILDIYRTVDPLDAWLNNSQFLLQPRKPLGRFHRSRDYPARMVRQRIDRSGRNRRTVQPARVRFRPGRLHDQVPQLRPNRLGPQPPGTSHAGHLVDRPVHGS